MIGRRAEHSGGRAPRRDRFRSAVVVLAVVLVGMAADGCHRKTESTESPSSSASSEAKELPSLSLKDDTQNALLTWVDEHGNFHVVEHTADVPDAGRDTVRVVVADRTDGTGDSVYVANLRQKQADGAYVVTSMARAQWDELGAKNRKARLEALAPSSAPTPAPPPSGVAAASDVTAIIYGASWCGPCHQAEALLKSLGVKVTKKDIEENPAAGEEMQEKLRRVHRQGGSIPVIDIAGQIMVGFSPAALRAAVDHARSGATL